MEPGLGCRATLLERLVNCAANATGVGCWLGVDQSQSPIASAFVVAPGFFVTRVLSAGALAHEPSPRQRAAGARTSARSKQGSAASPRSSASNGMRELRVLRGGRARSRRLLPLHDGQCWITDT